MAAASQVSVLAQGHKITPQKALVYHDQDGIISLYWWEVSDQLHQTMAKGLVVFAPSIA